MAAMKIFLKYFYFYDLLNAKLTHADAVYAHSDSQIQTQSHSDNIALI